MLILGLQTCVHFQHCIYLPHEGSSARFGSDQNLVLLSVEHIQLPQALLQLILVLNMVLKSLQKFSAPLNCFLELGCGLLLQSHLILETAFLLADASSKANDDRFQMINMKMNRSHQTDGQRMVFDHESETHQTTLGGQAEHVAVDQALHGRQQ